MKTTISIGLFYAFFFASHAHSSSCNEQFQKLKSDFYSRYQFENMRGITSRVLAQLTSGDQAEFAKLSERFNSINHDTPEHQDERFALQKQARQLTRVVTQRAGYKLMNAEEGSPFDAQILEKFSSDGYSEYLLELRSLLVLSDPRPHLTLWMNRMDKAHNPWLIVTIGFAASAKNDYVSWRLLNSGRIVGTVDEFVKSLMPAECRSKK